MYRETLSGHRESLESIIAQRKDAGEVRNQSAVSSWLVRMQRTRGVVRSVTFILVLRQTYSSVRLFVVHAERPAGGLEY